MSKNIIGFVENQSNSYSLSDRDREIMSYHASYDNIRNDYQMGEYAGFVVSNEEINHNILLSSERIITIGTALFDL